MSRGSYIARVLHREQKWRGNGKREIGQQPGQPEHRADALWLEENNNPKCLDRPHA
jgi:hypothetical protein